MGNIFSDIKTAVKLTGEVRKARKAGASAVKIMPVRTLPVFTVNGGFLGTAEGCALSRHRDTYSAVQAVYATFGADTKRALSFIPEEGEWADRMRFWKRELSPVLEPAQYHDAMLIIINWAVRCVKRRRAAV